MDDVFTMKGDCFWGVVGLAAAALVGGCKSHPGPAGSDRALTASYAGRTLTTDLPEHVRVPSVAAAAEMSLRHRGYSVTTSPTTEDYARVEGEAPQAGLWEQVVIRMRRVPGRTRVEIVAEPLGDQVLSRSVLDEMLAALGM